MKRFRIWPLIVLILISISVIAAQQQTTKKKSLSLDTDDVVTTVNPTSSATSITWPDVESSLTATKSFRCYLISNSGSQHFEMKMEFVSPDREHLINVTGDSLHGNDEAIRIGHDQYYLESGQRQWKRSPNQIDQLNPATRYITDLGFVGRTNFKMTGTESVDGTPCLIYKNLDTAEALKSQAIVYSTIWLRASDRLPVKVSGASDTGKILYTFTFSDYNENIKIERPGSAGD